MKMYVFCLLSFVMASSYRLTSSVAVFYCVCNFYNPLLRQKKERKRETRFKCFKHPFGCYKVLRSLWEMSRYQNQIEFCRQNHLSWEISKMHSGINQNNGAVEQSSSQHKHSTDNLKSAYPNRYHLAQRVSKYNSNSARFVLLFRQAQATIGQRQPSVVKSYCVKKQRQHISYECNAGNKVELLIHLFFTKKIT